MSKQYQKQKQKWKEQGRKEERERIKKKIDEIERKNWDCFNCGLVNEDVDKCKCGDYKENSVYNRKLEELKQEIENEREISKS